MSSTPETAMSVVTLMNDAMDAERVTARPMFGEFGLYVDGCFFAVVCDDTLFLKPLPEVRAALETVDEAPPYPGAKPWFRMGAELDDPDHLAALVNLAAAHLPPPKPRKARSKA